MPNRRDLLLLLLTTAAAAAPTDRHVAEPKGYWLGPIHGAVPATLAGGTVLDTAALAKLLASGGVVLVDVADELHRPSGLPTGTLWMPPLHRDIPGSVWIPGAGHGDLSAHFASWYKSRLAELTGANRNKPVVVYCHPHCWMSWNAAKRAVNDGYRRVYWYPGGVEGWEKAGYSTATVRAEGPDAQH